MNHSIPFVSLEAVDRRWLDKRAEYIATSYSPGDNFSVRC